jgi:CBS domain-containing protein
MKARDLMTPTPCTVQRGDPIGRAAELMRDQEIGFLAVVDSERRPVGVITDRDIAIRCVARRHPAGCTVADHMTGDPLQVVGPGADVSDVGDRMKYARLRRILVTEGGRLVGVIAQADLARKLGRFDPQSVEEVLERVSAPSRMVV